MEGNETIKETAKREALEEMGIEIELYGIIATFHVTLVSSNIREQMKIPPFIVGHATPISGQLERICSKPKNHSYQKEPMRKPSTLF